jgi:transposase
VAEYPISVHCPHCGQQHHGTIADGCLTDERSPPLAPPES